jgi:hypothetical protein
MPEQPWRKAMSSDLEKLVEELFWEDDSQTAIVDFIRNREDQLKAQLAERDARIAALTAAGDRLNGYAGHDDNCEHWDWRGNACDCGHREARQGWQQAKG